MMAVRLLRPLFLALTLVLAACSSSPPLQRFPEMTFRNMPPIRLDVGRIEVVPEYQPPAQPPHIEYDMPVAPENAVRRWVQDRLQPVGRTGTLRVVIHDAQATEVPLKTDDTITGVFKKEQAARIKMSVDVSIQLLDDKQFVSAEATGNAAVSRTTTEGIKLNEHDRVLYEMVEEMMKNFNANIEPSIRSSLGPIIVM